MPVLLGLFKVSQPCLRSIINYDLYIMFRDNFVPCIDVTYVLYSNKDLKRLKPNILDPFVLLYETFQFCLVTSNWKEG